MSQFIDAVTQWSSEHETLLWWLAAGSVVTFLATLVLLPMMIVRLPADYFARPDRDQEVTSIRHPALRLVLIIGKNILGWIFILAGIAMLALPGQGVLCILVGISIADFPGKYRLERWIVGKRRVQRTINWIRRKGHAPPIEPPQSSAES